MCYHNDSYEMEVAYAELRSWFKGIIRSTDKIPNAMSARLFRDFPSTNFKASLQRGL